MENATFLPILSTKTWCDYLVVRSPLVVDQVEGAEFRSKTQVDWFTLLAIVSKNEIQIEEKLLVSGDASRLWNQNCSHLLFKQIESK